MRAETSVVAHGVRPRRLYLMLAVVVGLLVAVNVLHRVGVGYLGLAFGPLVAAVLLVMARRHGLTWDDLGMGRRTIARGCLYAAAAVALVAVVYAIGAALPVTRAAFLDVRYRMPSGAALLTALMIIPIGTVLLEEIAFRGVLFGLVHRHRGAAWATAVSSVLFGLWHILPSTGLNDSNAAAGAVFGHGVGAQVAVVGGAVLFTGVAGVLLCELRRRSGSVLAAAGLHWATNGLGVLFAATLWALTHG